MPKRMLIDATHAEETRVAVIDNHLRLEHLDIVHAGREPLKGNIYLAKVKRIEPSLQAAFVEYGAGRHGFLPFAEIHPDYFRIPIADRKALMKRIADAEAKLESGDFSVVQPARGTGQQPGLAAEADMGSAPRDPFQPIVLDDEPFDSGRVHLTDVSDTPADNDKDADLDDNIMAATATDSDDDDDTEAADDDVPVVASANYETLGGSEDEMNDMRQRIRRQFLRNYRIQEVIKRGQVMLIQVVKEERGNKGAALTSYLSLAGRYCVLMPNSDKGGGVSRKISNMGDRRRLKDVIDGLEVPQGMSVILRTAGVERSAEEINRDFDYLVRLWDQIRETTLASTAPALIYEEANLIKRAIRDYYARDTDSIVVEGEAGYALARDFMRLLMPSHEHRVVHYTDPNLSLFARYQIENQIERLYQPTVQLKSGGYIVINPTEALVAIDVNSGRATRDRHIEETALRTNLEAADEIGRQLRLRDLAGLVVVDFIDMEDYKHNHQVERRIKEAMRHDRARLQIGRISPFGLLELSRQRLRPSLLETNYEKCVVCAGAGHVRSTDSAALSVIRAIADEGLKQKATELAVHVPTAIATYILNHKRSTLEGLEKRFGLKVFFKNDDTLAIAEHHIDRQKAREGEPLIKMPEIAARNIFAEHAAQLGIEPLSAEDIGAASSASVDSAVDDGDETAEGTREGGRERGRGRDRDRGRRNRRGDKGGRGERKERPSRGDNASPEAQQPTADNGQDSDAAQSAADAAPHSEGQDARAGARDGARDGERRRRRGRRGGRNRNREQDGAGRNQGAPAAGNPASNGNTPPLQQGTRGQEGYAAAYRSPHNQGATPTSVHEIDTTPKPHGSDDKPKAGWWRRWTS